MPFVTEHLTTESQVTFWNLNITNFKDLMQYLCQLEQALLPKPHKSHIQCPGNAFPTNFHLRKMRGNK